MLTSSWSPFVDHEFKRLRFFVVEQSTQKMSAKKIMKKKQCEDDIRQEVQVNYVFLKGIPLKTPLFDTPQDWQLAPKNRWLEYEQGVFAVSFRESSRDWFHPKFQGRQLS